MKSSALKKETPARASAPVAAKITLSALPAIGARIGGGFNLGGFFLEAKPYLLIGAPRKEGEFENVIWHDKYEVVQGALSAWDGLANTEAMVQAGSELAQKIRALRIGGHDDWYLLSRGEGLVAHTCGLTGPQAFPKKWHWTSTQDAANGNYAWIQSFSDGDQLNDPKDFRNLARAVRRLPIQ
jgi:hypothetical protein